MAQKRTVGSTGQEATLSSAMTWFQSNHNFTSDDIAQMEVLDSAEFNENVTVSGIAGIAGTGAFLDIYCLPASQHGGALGAGARVKGTTNGSHVFNVSLEYTRIRDLGIEQASTGGSDEGIRVNAAGDFTVISRCVIHTSSTAADTDGVYAGAWDVTVYVDNCLFKGWRRGACNAQGHSSSTSSVHNFYLDYLTIIDCGITGEVENGIHVKVNHTLSDGNMYCYNIYSDTAGGSGGAFCETDTTGDIVWTGTNNACFDTSLTSVGMTTSAQQTVAVNTTNFTAPASDDYSLPGTGSTLYGNGVNRVGSEPSVQQDFSLTLDRVTRVSGTDIGAFEYQAVVTGALLYHRNTNFRSIRGR